MASPFSQIPEDVADGAAVKAAAEALRQERELAVDLEADAMHAFRARLCYLQVGTNGRIFLFDTLQEGVSASLIKEPLEKPTVTKYFHAAGGDLQYLAEAGVRVKGLFDTHRAATLLGLPKVGLADLVKERMGADLKKEHQQSDFSVRPLPDALRAYIADDVRYLVEIGRQIREECLRAGILEEVELDCVRMCDEAAARPEVGSDYRPKFPRDGLSPSRVRLAQAIVTALHPKRLQWAEAANVPMGRMLSNAALGEIAARAPVDIQQLSKCPRVRGGFVREHGEEVLSLVRELSSLQREGKLPEDAKDKVKSDPQRKKREEALKTFRASMAAERKVTPSVVLTNTLVEDLAKNPPSSVEDLRAVPYFGEKRVELYGAALLKLLKAG